VTAPLLAARKAPRPGRGADGEEELRVRQDAPARGQLRPLWALLLGHELPLSPQDPWLLPRHRQGAPRRPERLRALVSGDGHSAPPAAEPLPSGALPAPPLPPTQLQRQGAHAAHPAWAAAEPALFLPLADAKRAHRAQPLLGAGHATPGPAPAQGGAQPRGGR